MGIMKDQLGVEDFQMTGYSVLLKAVHIPDVTKGGIYLTSTTINAEKRDHEIGFVVAMGIEAYTDKARFPFGPRCKVGDWVIFSKYEQHPIPLYDNLCYLLHDDRIITWIPEYVVEAAVPHLRNNIQQSELKGD